MEATRAKAGGTSPADSVPGRHRSEFDVTDRIRTTDPVEVGNEVTRLFLDLYPEDRSAPQIERAFHEFNSRSIQHLVHVMGTSLLKEFPSLSEVEFAAENHTPDAVADGKGDVRVFAEPRQTFGKIGLVLRR